MNARVRVRVAAMLALAATAASVHAQYSPIARTRPLPGDITPRVNFQQCGDSEGHFGPLDFRTIDPRDRRVVEAYHFDMESRTFLSGKVSGRNRAGSGHVVGGFRYTLFAIPNHPTALLLMDQLGRRMNTDTPDGDIPLECFYMRAFRIAPDDPAVRALYGVYLAHRGRTEEALRNLEKADAETTARPSLQYQIGLGYLDLKEYRRAQLSALRTASNPELAGLERTLKSLGKWDAALKLPDPSPAPDEAASAPQPASAPTADAKQ